MATLSRRVQVLLTSAQYTELDAQARRLRKSIGALTREALAEYLRAGDRAQRVDAVHTLASMNLPVADWEQMERESVGDTAPQ